MFSIPIGKISDSTRQSLMNADYVSVAEWMWNNLHLFGGVGTQERIAAVDAIILLRLITKDVVRHAIDRHEAGTSG